MKLFNKNNDIDSNNTSNKKKKKFSIDKIITKFKKFYNKKIVKNNNTFCLKEVVFVMLITFFFGMIIGGVIMYGKGTFTRDVSDSLNEFVDTYEEILSSYYEEVDSDELLQSGIEGMIKYLGDPHSTYMSKEQAQEFNEKVEGEYCGIGAEIAFDYQTQIVKIGRVFETGPAYEAGLKTDDILLKVDDESIEGMTTSVIASKVKGKKDTKVKVTVKRGEEELDITITRRKVDIESVEIKTLEKNNKKIGYMDISIFANNTYAQFKNKLLELEKENMDGLIIDVRGNSGGYLTTVTEIISLFTEKGDIIYQLKTKGKIDKIKDKTEEHRTYPIYVLVDSASASASEVLASSLRDNCGAVVIGTKTYGKGTVQKAHSLSNGAKIKYTIQEWLTPKGDSIDGVGVEPNNVIEYIYDGTDNDNQLEEALKEITK